MIKERATSTTWTSRRGLAWALRLSTGGPLVVAVVAWSASPTCGRPRHGLMVAGWYACCSRSAMPRSWATGKVMDRTLPLAALLEMSLSFPERRHPGSGWPSAAAAPPS